MSALDAWKETERAMVAQDLTLHNLGGDIWEVADQMQAALAEMEAENEGLRSRRLPYREAEIAQKRYEDAEAKLTALRDGIIRIIQCHNYPLVIEAIDVETGERGPHTVDGYNCADVLEVAHEVFPDFSAWDESRWVKRSTP